MAAVHGGGGGGWTAQRLRRAMNEDSLLRFTVADSVPGWDPRRHPLDTLLEETAAVLNDPRHPLVRAFGPIPDASRIGSSPAETVDAVRLAMVMQGTALSLVKKGISGSSSSSTATAAARTQAPSPAKAPAKAPEASAEILLKKPQEKPQKKVLAPWPPREQDPGLEGLRGALAGMSVKPSAPAPAPARTRAPAPAPAPGPGHAVAVAAAKDDDDWDVDISGGSQGPGRAGKKKAKPKPKPKPKKPQPDTSKATTTAVSGSGSSGGTAATASSAGPGPAGGKDQDKAESEEEEEEQEQEEGAAESDAGSDEDEDEDEPSSSSEDEMLKAQVAALAARQGRAPAAKKTKAPKKPRVVKPLLSSEHPLEFVCPISGALIADPVIAMDGSSYERAALARWFAEQEKRGLPFTSPVAGSPVDPEMVVPNISLRNLIAAYCREKGIAVPVPQQR